jgi:hypothetical protein
MDNCNASARMPATKSSNGVQSPRLIRKLKSRCWLRKRLATGFELFGPVDAVYQRLSRKCFGVSDRSAKAPACVLHRFLSPLARSYRAYLARAPSQTAASFFRHLSAMSFLLVLS